MHSIKSENKISFRILLKDTLTSLRFNWLTVTLFLVIYNFTGEYIILPFGLFILRKALLFSGMSFITWSNYYEALLNPLFMGAALFILLLFAFYSLYELITIILCVNEGHFKRKVRLIPLMAEGFVRCIRVFLPRNYYALVYMFLMVPLIHLGISSDFFQGLAIPGFIMESIVGNKWLHMLYWAGITWIVVYVLRTIFLFCFYALTNSNFHESAVKSQGLVRTHFWRTLRMYCYWLAVLFGIAVVFLIITLLLTFPINAIISVVDANDYISKWQSFGLGLFSSFYGAFSTVLGCFLTALSCSFITNLYYVYVRRDELSINPLPAVNNNTRLFPHEKLIFVVLCICFCSWMVAAKAIDIYQTVDYDRFTTISNGPQVTGHRGTAKEAPENTKAALLRAIQDGAEWVEIDINMTKDGVLVISHDETLSRTGGVNIDICTSNYDDIKDIDIGSFYSPEYSGERLMTLDEAIEICNGKVKMNIEIKPNKHTDTDQLVQKTIQTINKHNFKKNCVLASLNLNALLDAESTDKSIRTCFNTPVAYGSINKIPVDVYSIEESFVTQDIIKAIHKAGKQVFVWTVEDEDTAAKMTKLGVDNIITDDIPLIKQAVSENLASAEQTKQETKRTALQALVYGY